MLILHGMNLKCGKKCNRGRTSELIQHKMHRLLQEIGGNILKQVRQMFEKERSGGGTLYVGCY
jgi:hypothetical protein